MSGKIYNELKTAAPDLPFIVKENSRAKRMRLKIDTAKGEAILVVPKRTSVARAYEFFASHLDWIKEKLKEVPPQTVFIPDMEIEIFGEKFTLRHEEKARRGVWLEGLEIKVSGKREHFVRRTTNFIKKQALNRFMEQAKTIAQAAGVKFSKISIKDTRTRWGSCSTSGTISLCWRLAFAPPYVAEYVIAHEVAHIIVRGHSKKFWNKVSELCPDAEKGRNWLKQNGSTLFRIG